MPRRAENGREVHTLTILGRTVVIHAAQSYWYVTIDGREMITPHSLRRRFTSPEGAQAAAQLAVEQRKARRA